MPLKRGRGRAGSPPSPWRYQLGVALVLPAAETRPHLPAGADRVRAHDGGVVGEDHRHWRDERPVDRLVLEANLEAEGSGIPARWLEARLEGPVDSLLHAADAPARRGDAGVERVRAVETAAVLHPDAERRRDAERGRRHEVTLEVDAPVGAPGARLPA